MSYDFILVERDPPIATVRLNRPQVLNALSPEVKNTLGAAFGDKFTELNSDFAANANRLLASSDTSTLFKSTFNNIRLLGQRNGGRWNATTTAGIDAEYGN